MEAAEYELMDSAEESMWWYRAVHDRIEDILKRSLSRPSRILDAGCGTGGLLARLKECLPQHFSVGMDIDPGAGRRAAEKCKSPLVIASVNRLPFHAAAFDALLSIDVLSSEGVDETAALSDAHACLKPGGILVINLPAFGWMMSDHDRRVHNARRYRSQVRALLLANGFRPISVFHWNSVLFPLMVLRRKVFRPGNARSDVLDYPPLVNRLFAGALALEHRLASAGISFPFGGSVMAVAARSDE